MATMRIYRRALILAAVVVFVSGAAQAASRRVLVWLDGEPLAVAHARSIPPLPGLFRPLRLEDPDMLAQRENLRARRNTVRQQLEQLGFIADGETDVVLHTLMGRIPEENVEAAGQIPGVRLLRPVREYRLLLDAAVPLIKAKDFWPLLGGETQAGAGMKIAVIDTGIDIANPMFQDSRLTPPSGFPKGETVFTNSKVIVARSYVSLLGEPRDTADAMDREGHGSFVAGIAAGRRVPAPWAEIVGVAPAAQLGNYRVFASPLYGSYATDAAVIAAINDAVADGMNVINLSGGSMALDVPSEEPVPQAVTAAVQAGVVVVVAAGNEGDWLATISDPADAPAAIAVGSSRNARLLGYPLRVLAPLPVPSALQRVVIVPAESTKLTAALGPASLWHPTDNACSVPATSDAQGKIVVVLDSSSCSRSTKLKNLATAGALAGIIGRTDSADPREMLFLTPPAIPAFQMAYAAAQALLATVGLNTQGQATIDAAAASFPVTADLLSSFSSRGPSIDGELKPDVVAPGTSIYSAFQVNDDYGVFYSLAQFGLSDGTSFSAPLVAGAAALLKQAHPSWTPARIKSALVNTANTSVLDGATAALILGMGGGRVDVLAATYSSAAFQPTGLSFTSTLLSSGAVTVRRTLTVTNTGTAADTYTLTFAPRTSITGATLSVNPASLSLSAGQSGSVDVTFQSPATVRGSASLDGLLQVRAGSGTTYTVPYWGQVVDSTAFYNLFLIRGDGQTGTISSTLPRALAVQVTDSDWIGIAGAQVTFAITYGSGTLSASQVTTDFAGVAQVTLKLPATAGIVQVTASLGSLLSQTFTETARPAPVVTSGGVVSAAHYKPLLSAGGIAAIYGTGLAAATATNPGTIPLPTTLASAQVLFNGQPAPLFYASPTQINALVPFELAGATSAEMRVVTLGMASAPVTVSLSAVAPGILTQNAMGTGIAAAQHAADYSLVTSANPAHPGEMIVLYGVAFGAVQPVVTSSAGAPLDPLARTVQTTTVQIGSNTVDAAFAGLTPGLVGLYQVNFTVPLNTPPGDALPLVVNVGANSSNAVSLPVK